MNELIRAHLMNDEEMDKIEATTNKEGADEEEWWNKDREAGYTSEQGHADWD
jgi:hypothetical protein